jgi:hypothetical protein
MLSVRDLTGTEEPFAHFQALKRSRKVNGEKTTELTILPSPKNAHAFPLVKEESTLHVLDDDYVIKKLNEASKGKRYTKKVTAIHQFYVDLINKQQPRIHNGSITFHNYMEMVFEDTPYTFVVVDTFYARSFENLGNENRLALLQKGLDRFKAEFELRGNVVYFYHRIGRDTDFQFRYGHNIKAIKREVDTKNLATVISGTGDPELGVSASYRSPNVDIFGEIEADPVEDERFKSDDALREELISRLQDEPLVTLTLDFVDLRAAGYPYTIPNEGDRVWLIYEPMDELLLETRIMEITEHFKYDQATGEIVPYKTEVTLSNHKKSFAGTMFDNVRKQLDGIVTDDGVIRYNALDEAVRTSTAALQRALTELIFDNGIIARDKNDPNRLVLLNSEGIGISNDGGNTFREAVTADGFVLTAGAIGKLSANHIEIGPGTEFAEGYDPTEIVVEMDQFRELVEGAFRDGIIQESEAKAIESYINTIESEKAENDAHYAEIYTNIHLPGPERTNLLNAKVNYNGAYETLIQTILDAIEDGKTTPNEKAAVDAQFAAYADAKASLSTRLEQALDAIAQTKADGAESNAIEHADEHLGTFQEYVNNAFHDGIIEETEAKAIESYLHMLETEKNILQGRVDALLANNQIADINALILEETFYTGSAGYMVRYNNLVDAINAAIAGGKATSEERESVNEAFETYKEFMSPLLQTIEHALESITTNKVAESDDALREDLRLESPLPTSIRQNSDGITAYTSNASRYARLDHRGLYIAGGAIQIDGGIGTYLDSNGIYTGSITAQQVSTGFNNVSQYVKISSVGLETFSGLTRTSLLDHRGHRFFRDENHIGNIGTSHWESDPNHRGLSFQVTNNASFMTWSHDHDDGGVYTVRLIWRMDDSIGRRGFSFSDPVYIGDSLEVSRPSEFISRLTVGGLFRLNHTQFRIGSQGTAGIESYANAIDFRYDHNNRIMVFEDGQVEFRSGGTARHIFASDGSKSGGSIEIDRKNLGMSPVDSPQVLIEYIEFDVQLSPHGTKLMLDDKYLKAVSNFAAFPNNGEVVEKGSGYIIIKGNGVTDIRFVGERVEYENSFWADMKAAEETGELMQIASVEEQPEQETILLDGETGEMYRL